MSEKKDEEEKMDQDEKSSSNNGLTSDQRILLVPYPKIVFLYPTFLMALMNGIVLSFYDMPGAEEVERVPQILSFAFLIVMAGNMMVIGFDFPRATSLSLFLFGLAVLLGGFLVSIYAGWILGSLGDFIKSLHPYANATFYWCFTIVIGLIFIAVVFSVRFDYWEVRQNELLHHHGVLSDLKRYAAPNLRVDKEINDVFEYVLLRSGRLILHPSNEPKAIVLDNVLFINDKENRLTKLLGAIKVEVRT